MLPFLVRPWPLSSHKVTASMFSCFDVEYIFQRGGALEDSGQLIVKAEAVYSKRHGHSVGEKEDKL